MSRVVDEEDEGRRRDLGLRRVVDLQRLPVDAHAVGGGGLANDVVQLRRRDPPASLLLDLERQVEHLLNALAGQRRGEDDRRVRGELERLAQAFDVLVGGVGVLLDQVPLVDDHDQAPGGLLGVAGHVGVLGGHALDGVDDQGRHVGAFDRAQRPQHAKLLDAPLDPAAAADAGRVDQQDGLAVVLDQGVDRVAGRTRAIDRRSSDACR